MKTKAVLFDLDGTLFDTEQYVVQAYENSLRSVGAPVEARMKMMQELFGKTLEDCYKALAPEYDGAQLCEMHHRFQMENMHLVVPFATVEETLIGLKKRGIRMATVTNRTKRTAEAVLVMSQLDHYFEFLIAIEDVTHAKPHPEPIFTALNQLMVNPDEAWMVGDTEFDIFAGKAARVGTIGVTTGMDITALRKSEPDHVIDQMNQILSIV